MPDVRSSHVEVHVFRRRGRLGVEFLALRRAADRTLPGVWQPVTGRVDRGETALAAAAREVWEETGIAPLRWWALETTTVYYDAIADVVELLPLFAAEIAPDAVARLSNEHDASAFLPARAAGRRYLWEAQRRALEAVRLEVLRNPVLARALEVEPRRSAPRRAARSGVPAARGRATAAAPAGGRTRTAASPRARAADGRARGGGERGQPR